MYLIFTSGVSSSFLRLRWIRHSVKPVSHIFVIYDEERSHLKRIYAVSFLYGFINNQNKFSISSRSLSERASSANLSPMNWMTDDLPYHWLRYLQIITDCWSVTMLLFDVLLKILRTFFPAQVRSLLCRIFDTFSRLQTYCPRTKPKFLSLTERRVASCFQRFWDQKHPYLDRGWFESLPNALEHFTHF